MGSHSLRETVSMNTITLTTDRELLEQDFEKLTWLTTKEAAFYLRKSENALLIMVRRGYVRPRKFRRRLYFRRIELDRLLES